VRIQIIGVSLGLLALIACGGDRGKTQDSTALVASAARVNEHAALLEMRVNGTLGHKLALNCGIDEGVADDAVMIAGYHDKQKLPTAVGATTYGPEVHAYACPVKRNLHDFQVGTVVGIVQLMDASTGFEPYRNLGLEAASAGFYCLHVAIRAGDWSAAVSRIPDMTDTCPASPSYTLLVSRNEVLTGADKYPDAVMRIVDFDDRLPLFGIPCDAQWCEMGVETDAYAAPGGASGGTQEERVKGWQDEQAVGDKEGGTPLKRGARARLIPERGIAKFTSAMYRTPHPAGGIMGVKVATVFFLGAPVDKYRDTWGLLPGRTNIWMRRAPSGGIDTLQIQFTRAAKADPNGTWFLVKHQKHIVAAVPSTARWLWDPKDETIWLGCEQGCCEVTDGFALAASPSPVSGSAPARGKRP
jgi:hypothetical protein